jgi:hypothetical protein
MRKLRISCLVQKIFFDSQITRSSHIKKEEIDQKASEKASHLGTPSLPRNFPPFPPNPVSSCSTYRVYCTPKQKKVEGTILRVR